MVEGHPQPSWRKKIRSILQISLFRERRSRIIPTSVGQRGDKRGRFRRFRSRALILEAIESLILDIIR